MAKTINETLNDEYLKHQIYLLQYAQGLSSRAYGELDESGLAIIALVREKLEDVITLGLASPKTQTVLKELDSAIQDIRLEGWDKVNEIIEGELKLLAGIEAAAAVTIIDGAIPAVLNLKLPPASQLNKIIRTQPFEGKTLKQWLRRTENADIDRITSIIKIGISQGDTLPQVIRRLKGGGDIVGVMGKSKANVEALTRTVVNGIQNEAKQMLYEENSDVISQEVFIATLDIRTTLECASNDNKVFPIRKGPMPPLHFNCRSLRAPYINPEFWINRGFDSSVESEFLKDFATENKLSGIKNRADLPYGTKTNYTKYVRQRRRELVGQVPAETTFSEWLRRQSETFQNKYLGINRANAFRAGKFQLDRFVASDGSTLTLEQLRNSGLNI